MTTAPANLAGADWLASQPVRAIFAALDVEGDETRVIGGAVRNALMGVPVADVDIDFATTATPDKIAARATAAGIKAVPTGIEHGTVTLVAGGKGHQVTTLREDVETDGRHAVVRFGRDWTADAGRRDFTVNALSVDASGKIYDPLGGYGDLLARRIRFIGDADTRIAEDYLRILRLFRFHAEYGVGDIDRDGLMASIRGRGGLRELSAERIGQEMRRLAVAPRALDAATLMQDAGILPLVLAGVGYLGALRRLIAFEAVLGVPPDQTLRLAALGARIEEDVTRIAERLRLPNVQRDRMSAAVSAARLTRSPADDAASRRALYGLGSEAWCDGLALGVAWAAMSPDDPAAEQLHRLPERWPPPVFPLGGRDVIGSGSVRGPAVGAILKGLESWWIENDFRPDATALRQRLQQMLAGAQ
ncbi:MAG: CCA tRNA nucleotidyltransferase [Bauldia sp.]